VTTALITHTACLHHEPPPGHPERPARLQAVLDALQGNEFCALRRERAPRARLGAVARVHSRAYIKMIFDNIPHSGFAMVDSDTGVSAGSREAALRAAGAVIRAVDLVIEGEIRNAFCAVRPPGHHAEPARAMGFCLFNNVAIGVAHARAAYGIKRIAVIDFDVHHGNGTQALFGDDPNVFYGSTHQSPLYPGTGKLAEDGHIVNRPLDAGAAGPAFRRAFGDILKALKRFRPEFIFISAGFDAHREDPLAQLQLEDADFAWATEEVCTLADKLCHGRVVSVLEGGYDLPALARSARAHVQALMAA
jgi:acetoin utilization deacetylase AcuC-like enzyme